MTYITKPPN